SDDPVPRLPLRAQFSLANYCYPAGTKWSRAGLAESDGPTTAALELGDDAERTACIPFYGTATYTLGECTEDRWLTIGTTVVLESSSLFYLYDPSPPPDALPTVYATAVSLPTTPVDLSGAPSVSASRDCLADVGTAVQGGWTV